VYGRDMASNPRRGSIRRLVDDHPALLTFGLCGLAGVLVDVDHFISPVLWRYWFPQITEGRLWHTPLFILTSLVICYLLSRLPGLHSKLVLGGVVVMTIAVLIWSPYTVWSW